ncbi:MAG: filamentous hemagglutinin N-terminal domain-containing protein, partial [Azoarcus sp.]|nr:filamentous hemagglutinin N-terminal domain-containing protein [Azoarcus sp.]
MTSRDLYPAPPGLLPPKGMRAVARLLIITLLAHPSLGIAQALTPVTPVTPGVTVQPTGNHVPVVNIAAPNAQGLSHNQYQHYNVGPEGLILNNSTARVQPTQLGGLIQGNPALHGVSAQIILNEVTGGARTHLNGLTEIAGGPAHLIIANPHGLTCDGCGFLNTPRVTLATGLPVLQEGALTHYDIQTGEISIEGAGLDARHIDRFELITRSARLSAHLYAQQLDLILGANRVDATTLEATAQTLDGPVPPLALDSVSLGGLYAHAIRLIATEHGVGVRLAGNVAASTGEVTITSAGQLTIDGKVGSLDNHTHITVPEGGYHAGPDGELFAGDTLTLTMGAGGWRIGKSDTLTATAATLAIAGELTNQGTATLSGTLTATRLENTGLIQSDHFLALTLTDALNRGTIRAPYLTLTVAGELEHHGTLHGDAWLLINVGQTLRIQDGTLTSGSATHLGDLLVRANNALFENAALEILEATPGAQTAARASAPPLGDTGRLILTLQNDLTLTDTVRLTAQTDLIGLIGGHLTLTRTPLVREGQQLWVSGGNITLPGGLHLETVGDLGLIAAGELTLAATTTLNETTVRLPQIVRLNGKVLPSQAGPLVTTTTIEQHSEGVDLAVGGGLFLGAGQTALVDNLLGLTQTLAQGELIDGRLGAGYGELLASLLRPANAGEAA